MKGQFDVDVSKNGHKRISFAKIPVTIEFPDLLNVQKESFQAFLQEDLPSNKKKLKGLQQVFLNNFPIMDARENFRLEFVEYYADRPKYWARTSNIPRSSMARMALAASVRLPLRKLSPRPRNMSSND